MSDSTSEGGEMNTAPAATSGSQSPDSMFDDFDHAGPHGTAPPSSAQVQPVRRSHGHFVGSAGFDFGRDPFVTAGVTRADLVAAARTAGASPKEAEVIADLNLL